MPHRLTPKAVEDVESLLHQGIERFGVRQALAYHDGIENLFDLLARNPRMGRERTGFGVPLRTQPVASHIVVYEIEENDDVLILRVRHHRENWTDDPIGDAP